MWLEKEDFHKNLHILSCFVQLKSFLLISCVFWIFQRPSGKLKRIEGLRHWLKIHLFQTSPFFPSSSPHPPPTTHPPVTFVFVSAYSFKYRVNAAWDKWMLTLLANSSYHCWVIQKEFSLWLSLTESLIHMCKNLTIIKSSQFLSLYSATLNIFCECIIAKSHWCMHTWEGQGVQETPTRNRRMHVLIELNLAL